VSYRVTLRPAAVRRVAYEACDSGLLSPELGAGIRRVKGVRRLGVRVGNWLTLPKADSCWNGRTPPHCAENGTTPFWRCSSVAAFAVANFSL